MQKREPLRLPGFQVAIPNVVCASDRDRHIASVYDRKANHLVKSGPVDLLVLPELRMLPYSREGFKELDDLAEPLDGPLVTRFAELARVVNALVALGLARRTDMGFRISQVILSETGEVVACYEKMHFCQYGASCEKEFLERGEKMTVVGLKGWKMAPLSCYDIRIPEISRALSLEHNVDLLLYCGAYFRDESFATWHNIATTRAMENQVYLLSLNRAGKTTATHCFVSHGWMKLIPPSLLRNTPSSFACLNWIQIYRQRSVPCTLSRKTAAPTISFKLD